MTYDELLDLIRPNLHTLEYRDKAVITYDTAKGVPHVYLVLTGVVLQEFTDLRQGADKSVGNLKRAGDFIGLDLLFHEEAGNKAKLTAIGGACVGRIARKEFVRLMEGAAHGAAFALVAKKLGEENAALTSQLKRCNLLSLEDNLLEALHSLGGVRTPHGLKVTASVRLLAALTGLSAESVRRMLSRLSAQNKIATAGTNQVLLLG